MEVQAYFGKFGKIHLLTNRLATQENKNKIL